MSQNTSQGNAAAPASLDQRAPSMERKEDPEALDLATKRNLSPRRADAQRFKYYSAMKTGYGHLGNPH